MVPAHAGMKVTRLVGLRRRRNHLGTFYRVSPFGLVRRSYPLRRRSDMQPLYRRAWPAFQPDSVVNLGFLGSAFAELPWRLAVPPLAEVRCPYRLASPFSFARLVPSVGMVDYSTLLKYYFYREFGRIFRICLKFPYARTPRSGRVHLPWGPPRNIQVASRSSSVSV